MPNADGDEDMKPVIGAAVPPAPGMPHRVVHLERTAEIEAAREGLPIVGMEQVCVCVCVHVCVCVLPRLKLQGALFFLKLINVGT
jgi:hypothetical protein